MNRARRNITGWIIIIGLSVCAALFALGVIALPYHVIQDDGHGDTYSGDVLRGQWIGEVRIDYSDGSVYIGTLKDGRWDGNGIYRSADGWEYSGKFTDGRPDAK